MRIRIPAFLLAIVIVFSLLPLPAAAADTFTVSNDCVDFIKAFEGFSKYPYYDNGHFTVGYGTTCPAGDYDRYRVYGISEEEAIDLLKEHLDNFEDRVNQFIQSYNLSLQQHQFDALVSFTYNVGYEWMYERTGLMYHAVLNGMTGNDFLFAITLWSRSGENTVLGLVKRRLAEANLYLNGVYSDKVPDRYGYVLFDHIDATYEGVSRTIRVQGYDADLSDQVRSVAVSGNKSFGGWYSSASGGREITRLDHSTKGMRLYPRWSSNSESTAPGTGTDPVIARGKVSVRSGSLNIRSGAGTGYAYVGSLKSGTSVDIYQITTVGNVRWGKIDKGWICLTYVQLSSDSNQSGSSSGSGTVTTPAKPDTESASLSGIVQLRSGSLNVRSGPGTKYTSVGYLSNGTRVNITETVHVGNVRWGKTEKGWICLHYVQLSSDSGQNGSGESKNEDTVLYTGRVTLSNGMLNIRSGAGTNYSRVGSLANGSNVNIYEVTTANGIRWGRTERGWISMHYVTIN